MGDTSGILGNFRTNRSIFLRLPVARYSRSVVPSLHHAYARVQCGEKNDGRFLQTQHHTSHSCDPPLDKITGDETTDTKKARPSVILKLESASHTYPLLEILATKIFLAFCGIIAI